jgi:hypothetical protein
MQISGQEPHKREHALILTDRNRLIQHTSLILMTDTGSGDPYMFPRSLPSLEISGSLHGQIRKGLKKVMAHDDELADQRSR